MYDGMSMSDHKQWNGDVAVGKSNDGSLDRSTNYPINPSIKDDTRCVQMMLYCYLRWLVLQQQKLRRTTMQQVCS